MAAAPCRPEIVMISPGRMPDMNRARKPISVTNTEEIRAPVAELMTSPMANRPSTMTIAIH